MKSRLCRQLAALPSRLFPHRCALCGDAGVGRDLCAGCSADLPRPGISCRACAVALAPDGALCARCRRLTPPTDLTWAPLAYRYPADWLITELKFNARLWHGPLLADLIAEDLALRHARALDAAVVIPVPLHRRRLAARGYNQAEEIARPLAQLLGLRLEAGLVARHRATREQSSLSARARRRNVAGAFRLLGPAEIDHALIVDDVVTTGATTREIAALLRSGGCSRVSVVAAAVVPG